MEYCFFDIFASVIYDMDNFRRHCWFFVFCWIWFNSLLRKLSIKTKWDIGPHIIFVEHLLKKEARILLNDWCIIPSLIQPNLPQKVTRVSPHYLFLMISPLHISGQEYCILSQPQCIPCPSSLGFTVVILILHHINSSLNSL